MLMRIFRPSNKAERGDTLIEVILAVTVFSLIVVSALSLMNQGTATARRALETTIAREVIDSQAETLRFMHESYVAEYRSGLTYNLSDATDSPAEQYYRIVQHAKTYPKSQGSALAETSCPASEPSRSIAVNPATARVVTNAATIAPAEIYPEITYNSAGVLQNVRGVWVEAVRSPDEAPSSPTSGTGYIDFHIRACWMSVGSKAPVSLGTIVRLYEPRG